MKYTLITKKQLGSKKEMENKANNMTTIKEEILKEFDRNWIKPWKDNNFGVPNAHFTIKDFLIQSIDKVVEESKQQQIKLLEEVKKEFEEIYDPGIFENKLNSKITNLKGEL